MTCDQLHFEKYLLEQSKKRPKPKQIEHPTIIPIDLNLDEKTNEYLCFMSSGYRDKLFYELFKITEA